MLLAIDTYPFFQRKLTPTARRFAGWGITANQVTATSMVVSLIAGAAVVLRPDAYWALLLIPAALLVRLAFNHIDGMLARGYGMKTPLGGMLNELGDVACDAALYLPLAMVPGFSPWLVVALVALAAMAEMAGVTATTIGAGRRTDGPLAKKPRGLVMGALALAFALGLQPSGWVDAVLAVAVVLQAVTVIARVKGAVREAGRL